jgi:hypothetical protein
MKKRVIALILQGFAIPPQARINIFNKNNITRLTVGQAVCHHVELLLVLMTMFVTV